MITLFGIKNCDTVKKARRWLEAKGVDYQFHDFRVDGLKSEDIVTWIEQLGIETLINKRSTTWKGLSDSDKDQLNESTAIKLIMANPTLIKRPLLAHSSGYSVGFKETTYQDLFKA